MAQSNIVFFNSTRQGAPVITGQVNTLNAALYQLLCTGWNSQALTSITRSGSVATVTKTAHGFQTWDWILISGADPTDYNGMKQVTGYTANTFTFTVSGTPADASTAGTAVCAPLGWERIYNSGNKSVYYGDDQSSRLPLYVDDSGAIGSQSYRVAFFKGYEQWNTDVGVNAWPTAAQLTNGLVWMKSSTLDATARQWWVWGDGKRFIMGNYWAASYSSICDVYCFGDYLNTIPGNAYPGFIIGSTGDNASYPGSQNTFSQLVSLGSTSAGKYLCRKYDSIGSAIAMGMKGDSISSQMGKDGLPGVNQATAGYEINPIDFVAGTSLATASYYSKFPGVYQFQHDQLLNNYDILPEFSELSGRRLIVLVIAAQSYSQGRLVLDLTGPL